ncbi:uncharacterized protein I206_105436 [Kwoniella pini CBS 10737]|uniref:AB hydrolase-1 domain-containing protein n=1 Tax=Kwoniella pini CBS 10737 TaxID=1296096 RepID=A0A1B9I4A3_9TREE|nr:uncharacterized protein I206_03658 [Kwoniella pini CBS 10737]OCF50339.1 hypothetical protein I206_03658 [Kwoniella pini CBS 10737]
MVIPLSSDPTALSNPESYLSLKKFNRRIKKCPRTNLSITFSDIGSENGIPLLYLLPSGCSRWIAAPMDPLLKIYGVRMIVVDRPGCGGTSQVSLDQRINQSCEMIVSVLEYLNIKPTNILASSAGIYYALHLLTRHSSIFSTNLNPPPKLYLLSPWCPLLSPDDQDYWHFKWDWIPTPLISTQHITTPHLIKAANQAEKVFVEGMKLYTTSKTFATKWYKNITEDPSSLLSVISPSSTSPINISTNSQENEIINTSSNNSNLGQSASDILNNIRGGSSITKPSIGEGIDVSNPVNESSSLEIENSSASNGNRMWGKCEEACCVACLTQSYMTAENAQGIGQEHLICLNRGTDETGSEWLKTTIKELADTIEFAQLGELPSNAKRKIPYPIEIEIWWGWLDDMVPRKGQIWFNKILGSYPDAIDLRIHDVEDGDHTDL